MMYDQKRAQQPAGRPRGPAERRTPGPEPLLPSDEQDKIVQSLRHALNTFADTPLKALEEAESAYDEATAQLVNALAERRRLLRAGWQDQDPGTQSDGLRLALRQYREIIQRLLHV
ncbi:hypothetical protein ACM01_31950 [Streptomyces viridochromogenes]|uniref:Uncharacterized protein n=1 Tax=Streptomyces viridochromogenes TaxID=1938 RepID=A0A0J8BXU1_STRVR|nr:hypothetical protein [Streptomyces viridochromogenes]KMS70315.1 hypothetical protein ACM01_31950 [Streptomyces viridochromogenes]KOG17071.1 hypothetical protein ADK35_24735 [Streptomyces viridochromogenes]KOG20092.1 hypothetical protein ADK36_17395 [Streptomyces viridochromogenes]